MLTVVGLLAGAAGTAWLKRNVLSSLPEDLSAYRDYRPQTSARIYAQDGTLVDEFYLERRVWVPIRELPEIVWRAFVLSEDRRFFEHEGVDFPGIARALYVNLTGGAMQGGSTLTQQLVKNLIVGKERSYKRKLREAVLAWRLENELSKEQILELYINFVPLGNGNYGVEAAARDYFGLSARNLDPGQAALLAGLVPAPSRYSPRQSPRLARERRALVLGAMVRDGLITADVAALAERAPVLTPRDTTPSERPAVAYVTEVRRQIRAAVGTETPFKLGLQIHTPLDLALQQVATKAIGDALAAHLERQGVVGPTRHLTPEEIPGFLASSSLEDEDGGEATPPAVGQCFDALVPADRDLRALQAGTWTFALDEAGLAMRGRTDDPEQEPQPLVDVVQPGDVLPVCLAEGRAVHLSERPWAEGAAVVLENATGRVVALVGGRHESLEGFVRATSARRQPGSSFKPYVYAAALLAGRSQLDRVTDGPVSLPAGGGQAWSPKNYDGKYEGPVLLRRALARSLNTVAVRLILETGAAEVARLAAAMGVRSPIRTDLTIALGSSELTPLDQALGYSTIARGGVPTDPVFIDQVADMDGAVLGQAGQVLVSRGQPVGALPGGPRARARPAGVAYELADMLREVVRAGTAKKASAPDLDRAGKTGTTNNYQDAWFCGFTPSHTIIVWIGTDGTRTLGPAETGGKTALPAWMAIADALPDQAGQRLAVPPDVLFVPADGGLAALPRAGAAVGAGPLPPFGGR